MISVQIRSETRITRRDLEAARRAIAGLDRYVDRPLSGARLTVRRGGAAAPYAVDATVRRAASCTGSRTGPVRPAWCGDSSVSSTGAAAEIDSFPVPGR